MDFNKNKCLELMKESKKLRQEGKSLWDFEKAKYEELSQYLILLSDDVFWQSRTNYLQIIESFVSRSIDVEEFIKQFAQLRRENMDGYYMLKKNLEAEAVKSIIKSNEIDIQLNPQSVGFTEIIGSIYASIDLFDPDIDLDTNLNYPELIGYGISEEFLRFDIKDNFLPRIGEYCKES